MENYDELIKALRKCGKASADRCWDCTYYDREPWCESALANDAADALEAADKRIAELEAHMPKEGEWMTNIRWDYQQPTQTVATNVGTTFMCRSTGKLCPNATEYGYCKQTVCNNCGAKMKGEQDE